MKRPKSTPSATRREALTQAIRKRGQSPYNLWLIRPPFDSEDILVNCDPLMELFYLIEGEPTLEEIDYQPLRSSEPIAPRHGELHFANASHAGRSVRIVWVPDADSASLATSANELKFTPGDLDRHRQRIGNWRQIIAQIRRAALHDTVHLQRRIEILARKADDHTVRTVTNQLADQPQGLVLGALAICLRERILSADLDEKPWSFNTRLWKA